VGGSLPDGGLSTGEAEGNGLSDVTASVRIPPSARKAIAELVAKEAKGGYPSIRRVEFIPKAHSIVTGKRGVIRLAWDQQDGSFQPWYFHDRHLMSLPEGVQVVKPYLDALKAIRNEMLMQARGQATDTGVQTPVERGGPGSGHFAHEGRPGQIGGSAPGNHRFPVVYDERLTSEAEYRNGVIVLGPKFYKLDDDGRAQVMAHEEGHALSDEMLADGRAFALQDRGAFQGTFGNETVDGINGQVTPGENVAEAYAVWKLDPEWLLEHYPLAYQAIEDAMAGNGLSTREPGGDKTWATLNHPGDTVVYHTRAYRPGDNLVDLAETIKAEGIKRGEESAGRPPSVYFCTDPKRADSYGYILGQRNLLRAGVESPSLNLRGYAVASFVIPDEADLDVHTDYSDNMMFPTLPGKSFRVEADIRPEWIQSVTLYDYSLRPEGPPALTGTENRSVARRGPMFGYAVIFLAEAPEMIERGGRGSGHFGHAGRPGEVGGSLPGEGGLSTGEPQTQEHLRLTKAVLARIIKWSTSRYNEMSKSQAIQYTYDMLSGSRKPGNKSGQIVISCGSFTPSSAMNAGGDYLIDPAEHYIVAGLQATGASDDAPGEGFAEMGPRYYFDVPPLDIPAVSATPYSVLSVGAATDTASEAGKRLSAAIKSLPDEFRETNLLDPARSGSGWLLPDGSFYVSYNHTHGSYVATKAAGIVLDAALPTKSGLREIDAMMASGVMRIVKYSARKDTAGGLTVNLGRLPTRSQKIAIQDWLAANPDAGFSADYQPVEGENIYVSDRMYLSKIGIVERGGPGSGHFGHGGRPGERGGSAPSGGLSTGEPENSDAKVMADRIRAEFDIGSWSSGIWIGPDGDYLAPFADHQESAVLAVYGEKVWKNTDLSSDDGAAKGYDATDSAVKAGLIRYNIIDNLQLYMDLPAKGRITDKQWTAMQVLVTEFSLKAARLYPTFASSFPSLTLSVGGAFGVERPTNDVISGPQAFRFLDLDPDDIVEMASSQKEVIRDVKLLKRGGPGSGHFGHEGRLGEVGGSLPSDGLSTGEPGASNGAREVRIRKGLEKIARQANTKLRRVDNAARLKALRAFDRRLDKDRDRAEGGHIKGWRLRAIRKWLEVIRIFDLEAGNAMQRLRDERGLAAETTVGIAERNLMELDAWRSQIGLSPDLPEHIGEAGRAMQEAMTRMRNIAKTLGLSGKLTLDDGQVITYYNDRGLNMDPELDVIDEGGQRISMSLMAIARTMDTQDPGDSWKIDAAADADKITMGVLSDARRLRIAESSDTIGGIVAALESAGTEVRGEFEKVRDMRARMWENLDTSYDEMKPPGAAGSDWMGEHIALTSKQTVAKLRRALEIGDTLTASESAWLAKWGPAWDEYDATSETFDKAYERIGPAEANAVRAELLRINGGNPDVAMARGSSLPDRTLPETDSTPIRAADDYLSDILSPTLQIGSEVTVFKTIEADIRSDRGFYDDGAARSASAQARDKGVYVPQGVEAATFVHEFGHHLEAANPGQLLAGRAFLYERSAGKELKWLGLPYEPDELAYINAFPLQDYAAKLYGVSRARAQATEILSCGLQRLFVDPKTLATKDREWFDFVVLSTTGKIAEDAAWLDLRLRTP
jgi:hypothetical protein